MVVYLCLAVFWTFYGFAGILGFQRIPAKYKNKVWTKDYIRSCGMAWLTLGVPSLLLYAVASRFYMPWAVTASLIVLLTVPSIVFSCRIERKFKAKLEEEL